MKRDALNAWAKPLLDALTEIENIVRDHPGDASMLKAAEAKIAALPLPDFLALSQDMAEDMERAAVDELVTTARKYSNVAAFAPENPGFGPLQEAIDRMARKTPVVSSLNSKQWARVPLGFRERGQFSSGVESIKVMGNIQSKLVKSISQQRELLANGKERYVSRDSFIRDIRQIALDEGLDTGKGNVLTNIASPRRIGLIYDMQNAQAAGHARWKLDNDKDALAIMPAWRLGPSSAREPRPEREWRAKWAEAGAAVGWKGAVKNEMVALKTSPIWSRLSTFGTPWPPFDWGSTRELEDVWRDEAEQLGLVKPDETVEPTAEKDFNDEVEASVSDWQPDQVAQLKSAFGDQVVEQSGRVQWQGNIIGDLYRSALDNRNLKRSIDIGVATARARSLAGAKGGDLTGYKLQINADDIRHATKRHGVKSPDRYPIEQVDIEIVPHVWRDPDEITQGADGAFLFKKNIMGRLVFVEFQRSIKNKLAGIKTIRREK